MKVGAIVTAFPHVTEPPWSLDFQQDAVRPNAYAFGVAIGVASVAAIKSVVYASATLRVSGIRPWSTIQSAYDCHRSLD